MTLFISSANAYRALLCLRPGLELGHMEVDEKMVIVVVKACSLWGRQT